MNCLSRRSLAACVSALAVTSSAVIAAPSTDKPEEMIALMEKAADWQLNHPNTRSPRDWTNAVFYRGLFALSQVSKNPAYLNAVTKMAEDNHWETFRRVYHADDHTISQTYLSLYDLKPSPEKIAPTKERFDFVLANPKEAPLNYTAPDKHDRWSWCDALFMAPPAWTHLAAITGDHRYLDFVDREWDATRQHLYDSTEHLFFRDARFLDKKSPNGSKIFWSRGNGWVFAGLPLLLKHWPKDHPSRAKYEAIFKEMAPSVLKTQQPDGLWRANLLEPNEIPHPETSGSALFVYGMAWGVNHGLLDKAVYGPAIERGWKALAAKVRADGMLENVQPIGYAPDKLDLVGSWSYGTGALLLAGCEIYQGAQR